MNLMFQPLRKYADFTGRARRSEYWLFWLFTVGVELAIILVTGGLSRDPTGFGVVGGLLYIAVALGLFIPSLAVAFRRLHDIDRSAWWLFIALVPLIGAIVLLVFDVMEGTRGPNRYGPDPKAGDEAAVVS